MFRRRKRTSVAAASAASRTTPPTVQPTMRPTGVDEELSSPEVAATVAGGGGVSPAQRCTRLVGTGVCGRTMSLLALKPQPARAVRLRAPHADVASCTAWTPGASRAACSSVSGSMHARTLPAVPSVASVSSATKSSTGTTSVTLCSSTTAPTRAEVPLAVVGAAVARAVSGRLLLMAAAVAPRGEAGTMSTCVHFANKCALPSGELCFSCARALPEASATTLVLLAGLTTL